MNILVINSGSSSIKYRLFRMPDTEPVCIGLVERIGEASAVISHKVFMNGAEQHKEEIMPLANHEEGLEQVVSLLTNERNGIIKNTHEIHVVGHRVVHGGEMYSSATLVTTAVKENIKALSALAPLHNPANLTGIEVAEKIFTSAKQVAVFDTAFHQTLPDYAFRYAIPDDWYRNDKIRVYGFHGTSHQYVTEQVAAHMGKKEARLISIHLGNGCSMAAVKNGVCIDTSMGFSPLAGLTMGTRSGDIDPSVLFYLYDKGYSSGDISNLLNKQSGMQGLTGFSDMRDINRQAEAGDEKAILALNMYAYRIRKYIGAYASAMNGLDAIIFTAGVGENDATMRKLVCTDMDFLGIAVDDKKNESRSREILDIGQDGSKVKVWVVPTNEELEIARQCYTLLGE